MLLKCYCKNNTPVRLPKDEKNGERYECYYCKCKWRYIEVHDTICSFCDSHGITIKNKIVECRLCGTQHHISNYGIKTRLVFW